MLWLGEFGVPKKWNYFLTKTKNKISNHNPNGFELQNRNGLHHYLNAIKTSIIYEVDI